MSMEPTSHIFRVLENLFTPFVCEQFMYMGERAFRDKTISIYKHIISREYINVDAEGQFYRYETATNTYVPVAFSTVKVFAKDEQGYAA